MSHPPFWDPRTVHLAGAPQSFDLRASLRAASEVWVATAFAHRSGWDLIRKDLLHSEAKLTFLTGIAFSQTEPYVLRDWIGKAFTKRRARAFLFIGNETFHPKVFVVRSPGRSFALIGSGNLSSGGLGKNIECFAYCSDAAVIEHLITWVKTILRDRCRCELLTSTHILAYEPKWRTAKRLHENLDHQTRWTVRAIANVHAAQMHNWIGAVSEARRFFQSSKFRRWHSDLKKQARQVLRLLHHPRYDFTQREWSNFYDIWHMGHLIPINKNRVFHQQAKLRAALRHLSRIGEDLANRVDAILTPTGSDRVSFLGINAVSKILASADPQQCPVWNNPVQRSVRAFGYKPPRGATPGQKYAAFAELMEHFMRETGAPDMLALDSFFYAKDLSTKDSKFRKVYRSLTAA
jgi:hypothetical protein